MQIPPMYSACKIQGKRLYELAREGVVVERPPRPVHIRQISLADIHLPRAVLEVTCSKGTYIRTLCHDIGQQLGCGGCMEELLRTRSGMFGIDQALKLSQAQKLFGEGRLEDQILRIEDILSEYPRLDCTADQDRLLDNGNPLPTVKDKRDFGGGWIRVYDSRGVFKGIYQHRENTGKYFPVKMFL